jgi:hypothetical protein
MNEQEFWQIIERSLEHSEGDGEVQLENLETELLSLEPDKILGFHAMFWTFHRLSYRTDLWGAAFIINGGASDDGFDYFRGWLITQGRKVFEAALENPDSLAGEIEDAEADFGFENEDIMYLAMRCWCKKTGLDIDAFYARETPSGNLPELGDFAWSDGEGDMDERKGQKLYPKLWKKFDL